MVSPHRWFPPRSPTNRHLVSDVTRWPRVTGAARRGARPALRDHHGAERGRVSRRPAGVGACGAAAGPRPAPRAQACRRHAGRAPPPRRRCRTAGRRPRGRACSGGVHPQGQEVVLMAAAGVNHGPAVAMVVRRGVAGERGERLVARGLVVLDQLVVLMRGPHAAGDVPAVWACTARLGTNRRSKALDHCSSKGVPTHASWACVQRRSSHHGSRM
jgi:hypothetical protein